MGMCGLGGAACSGCSSGWFRRSASLSLWREMGSYLPQTANLPWEGWRRRGNDRAMLESGEVAKEENRIDDGPDMAIGL